MKGWLSKYDVPKAKDGIKSIGEKTIYPNGVIKQTPNRVQQFLSNLSGEWNEHKPQLMKDFPITDFSVGPVLDYVSGKSDIAPILPTTSAKWIPTKGNYYRIVGKDALDDMVESGVVRTNHLSKSIEGKPLLVRLMENRPTKWPSFSKNKPSMGYAESLSSKGIPHVIYETSRPMKASTMMRHGKGTTQFPINSEGKFIDQFPANEVNVLYPNKHIGYSKYPEFNNFKNGGIIPKAKDGKDVDHSPMKNIEYNADPEAAWIQNWLNNRKDKLVENARSFPYPLNEDRLESLSHRLRGKTREFGNELFIKQKNNIDNTLQVSPEQYKKITGNYPKGIGSYHTIAKILYSPEGDSATEIHERTHSAIPTQQIRKIENMYDKGIISKNTNDDFIKSNSNYFYDPSEVYSRMMELRYKGKFDPSKTLNINDIKELRNKYESDIFDSEFFKMFNDDDILKLFNEVAYNQSDSSIPITKNGGTVKNSLQLTNFTNKQPSGWLDKY